MRRGDFYSTGQVAAVLGISRSTVTRMFDRGELAGKVNPVTGERLISEESLAKFIRDNDLAIDVSTYSRRRVVWCSPDPGLTQGVSSFCSKDNRLALRTVTQGVDALVTCLKFPVNLLVLDDDVCDMDCSQVLMTIRRQDGDHKLKVLVLRRSDEEEYVDTKDADLTLPASPEPDLTRLGRAIYDLLDISAESATKEEPVPHRRKWRRIPVGVPVNIRIEPTKGEGRTYSGKAVIRDISQGGAFLTGIDMDEGSLPAKPFQMTVTTDRPPLGDWQARCNPLRIQGNGGLGAGVVFTAISEENRKRIDSLAGIEQWR